MNIFDLKFLQVFFKKWGEILVLLKKVEFLEFFGFTLCFRTLEKKARVAWQSLVNLLGTHTYKLISFRTVGPIHWAMASK